MSIWSEMNIGLFVKSYSDHIDLTPNFINLHWIYLRTPHFINLH